MREKDYYGAIKGFCLKWNLPEVWNSDRITGANLIYEVIKVINAMIKEQKEVKEMVEDFIKMFDENLDETITNILTEWKDSGVLEGIINDALFNEKLDKDIYYDELSIYNKFKSNFIVLSDFPKLETDQSDSERIIRAIDSLEDKFGGTIYLGYGNLDIGITIPIRHNINLLGEGISATKLTTSKNISIFKNTESSRIDYFKVQDMSIRRSGNHDVPLIDFENVSYSTLLNLYVIDFDKYNKAGNTGLLLKNRSYYNTIQQCQFVYFHTGIHLQTMANGNTILGGSCIYCIENGVLIDNTDSTKLISHSVELETVNAYKVINSSYYNNFISCRVEATDYSYVIPFISGKESFSNMIVGGLDYSRNKTNISGSNPYLDYAVIDRLKNNYYTPNLLATLYPGEQVSLTTDFTVFNFNRILQDRTNNFDTNTKVFKVSKKGVYNFGFSMETQLEQPNGIAMCIIINGTRWTYPLVGKKNFSTSLSLNLKVGDEVVVEVKASLPTIVFSDKVQLSYTLR